MWSKCKKDGRDVLVKKLFVELEIGSNTWRLGTSAILEGFAPKKAAIKKNDPTCFNWRRRTPCEGINRECVRS